MTRYRKMGPTFEAIQYRAGEQPVELTPYVADGKAVYLENGHLLLKNKYHEWFSVSSGAWVSYGDGGLGIVTHKNFPDGFTEIFDAEPERPAEPLPPFNLQQLRALFPVDPQMPRNTKERETDGDMTACPDPQRAEADGAAPPFSIGDIVQLKSGGAPMTVIEICCCNEIKTVFAPANQRWQTADDIYEPLPRECLPAACLKHADEPAEMPF